MICLCGGLMRHGTHQVKTQKKADEWLFDRVAVFKLPITINQESCLCGRFMFSVFDANMIKIYEQG